jgi:TonB-linked SusC/RagA family outer membrane protein
MSKILLGTWLLTLLLCLPALAQNGTVSGRVTSSDDGSALPGVSVQIKGTTQGTTTDADGNYRLGGAANRTLVFSFIGFINQEVAVGNRSTVNVTLAGNAQQLSEIVVVGYGTQSRQDATGSIASVKGAAIAQTPIQSFESGLAGRSAGVQITQPNGVLNNPPVFRIRGTNSISLSSYPLVVVDGVPTFTGDQGATSSPTNPLASINPSDIESIDIAKDAAATAIYGSRAANGVVFVTTKRGKSGKARISYDGWYGVTSPYRLPQVLNASEYLSYKGMAVANNQNVANSVRFTQATDANGNPVDTRWYDYIYRNGASHNHNLNVSGGNDNTTYYFSVGYTDQQGIIQKNDFKRFNGLLNLDSKISKLFSVGGKLSYSNEQNLAAASSGSLSGEAFATSGLGRVGLVLPPILPAYNNDGSYNTSGANVGVPNIAGATISYPNPVPSRDLNRSNTENNHIQSFAYLQFKPLDWITVRSQYGIDYLLLDNDIFQSPITAEGYNGGTNPGNAYGISVQNKQWLWTNTVQATRSFNKVHNFDLLLGQEQQRRTLRSYGIFRQGLSDPAYNVIQAGYAVNNPTNMTFGENYLLSFFGRLNYNYKERYLLSGNLRQDEYSALGQKRGLFFGASAGWEITQENFWKNSNISNVISSLKIRGSYGKVGNIGGIGDYTPYSTFASGLYGGQASLFFSAVGNPNLRWETSTKSDVGINFGLFSDRLTGEIALYRNNIDNLILNVAQAPSAGLPSNPPQNIGTMYNQGLEFSLNARVVNKAKFTWNSSFNITLNKNEVTSLAPGLNSLQTATSLETVNQTQPGYSLGYLWVVRTNGVDPQTGKRIFVNSAGQNVYYQFAPPTGQFAYSTTPDGLTRYVSPTGGSSITQAADAVMYGNVIPKVYGGFDNNFKIGPIDLGVLLTYQLGFNVYYGTNAGLHDQRFWNNDRDVLTDAWMKEGDTGKKYARPVFNDNVSNGSAFPLDINVFKGDFVKLRNVTIGYNLPASLLSRAKISTVRLYASGQNLAILTKYPGPDPEVSSNGNSTSSQGVDRNTVANGRTYTVGLKIGF